MLEEFRRLSLIAPDECDEPVLQLTPREQEVLSLVARGLTDKQISADPGHQPAYREEPPSQHFVQAACQQPAGSCALGEDERFRLVPQRN